MKNKMDNQQAKIKSMAKEKEFKNDKTRKVYMYYLNNLFNEKRVPYQRIADHIGITREAVRQKIDKLVEEGYLITIPHQKNQKLYLPHEWFEEGEGFRT